MELHCRNSKYICPQVCPPRDTDKVNFTLNILLTRIRFISYIDYLLLSLGNISVSVKLKLYDFHNIRKMTLVLEGITRETSWCKERTTKHKNNAANSDWWIRGLLASLLNFTFKMRRLFILCLKNVGVNVLNMRGNSLIVLKWFSKRNNLHIYLETHFVVYTCMLEKRNVCSRWGNCYLCNFFFYFCNMTTIIVMKTLIMTVIMMVMVIMMMTVVKRNSVSKQHPPSQTVSSRWGSSSFTSSPRLQGPFSFISVSMATGTLAHW